MDFPENKFEDITDQELKDEIHDRDLVDKDIIDIQSTLDETQHELDCALQESEDVSVINSDIQVLCDSYQYSEHDAYLRNVKAFLVEHGGLIA